MPLNQLVDDVEEDCGERETGEEPSRSGHKRSGAVQVMAEDITEPAIDACIESGANGIQGQEPDSAGAQCSRQGRRHRVQPGNKLGHQ